MVWKRLADHIDSTFKQFSVSNQEVPIVLLILFVNKEGYKQKQVG